jgi:hypothetical protein
MFSRECLKNKPKPKSKKRSQSVKAVKVTLLVLLCLSLSAVAAENNRSLPDGFKAFLQQYEAEFSGRGVDPIFTEGQLSARFSAVRAIFDAWIFMDANNEGHLLRLEGLEQYYGVPQKRIRFYDVLPKTNIEVPLTSDSSGQYHYGEMVVGGIKVYVKVHAENINYPATQLTWGIGSTYGEVGTQRDRFDWDLSFAQPVPPPTVTYDLTKPPLKNCRGMAKEAEQAVARYKAEFAWFPLYYHAPILVEGELSNAYTSARGTLDGWVIGSRLLQAGGLPTVINGLSVDKITFVDNMTGETFKVALQARGFVSRSGYASSPPGSWFVAEKYHQGTFVLDGETVFVQVVYVNTTRYPAVQLTWGAGATYGLVGDEEDRFDCEPPVVGTAVAAVSDFDPQQSQIVGVGPERYRSGIKLTVGSAEAGRLLSVTFTQNGTAEQQNLSNVEVVVRGVHYPTVVADATARRYTAAIPFERQLVVQSGFFENVDIEWGLNPSAAGKKVQMDIARVEDIRMVGEVSKQRFTIGRPRDNYRFSDGVPWFSGMTLTVDSPPSITMLSPNGGEVLHTGSEFNIRWEIWNLPPGSEVLIQLRGRSALLPRKDLATVLAVNGSYRWKIPSDVPPGDYLIEIYHVGANGSPADGLAKAISHDSFTIQGGAAPSGGGGGGGQGGGTVVPTAPPSALSGDGNGLSAEDLTAKIVKEIRFGRVGGGPLDGHILCVIWLKQPFETNMRIHFFLNGEEWVTSYQSEGFFQGVVPAVVVAFIVPNGKNMTPEWVTQNGVVQIR